jgi:hypothetical protein
VNNREVWWFFAQLVFISSALNAVPVRFHTTPTNVHRGRKPSVNPSHRDYSFILQGVVRGAELL